MTRPVVIFLFLIAVFSVAHSQQWVKDLRAVLPKKEDLSDAVAYKATKSNFLFYTDSCEVFERIVEAHFAKSRTWKKYKIKNSTLLHALCKEVTTNPKLNNVFNATKHYSYLKRFNRAIKSTYKSFRYIEYAAFDIEVVRISQKRFYDGESGDSPYHLYYGHKPTKKELESGEYTYKGCKLFTEAYLADKVIKKLKDSKINSYLTAKEVLSFGVSCVPKERTVYRNGIPTIRVFVMIGISRVDEKKLTTGRNKSKLKRERKKAEAQAEHISLILNQKKKTKK